MSESSLVPGAPRAARISLWAEIGAIVALAALVRVAVLWSGRIVWGDEPFYLWLGRNWVTGQGYTFTAHADIHHTPLFPLLSGLLYLLMGNMETASDVLYVVFGALLTIPIFAIGREMYSQRVGLVAGLLVGIWPALAISVAYWGTMTEPLYYFLIYTGILFGLLALRDRGLWAYALCGVFFGLAYLTRPEAVTYLVAVAASVALVRLAERQLFARRTLLPLASLLLGYAFLFLPYAAYVHSVTGEWMVSEKAGVTYVLGKSLAYGDTVLFDQLTWGLDKTGNEVYFFSTESYDASMMQDILQDPTSFLRMVHLNTRRFVDSLLSVRLFPVWLAVLVALGWLKRSWSRERLKAESYLLVSMSPILVFLAFFIQDRYIGAVVPGLIVWLANGTVEVQEWLGETTGRLWSGLRPASLRYRALTALPVVLLVAYLASTVTPVVAATQSGSWRPEHKTIGLWLRDNVPPGGTVMSRYPTIAFYAGQHWVPTPNAPIADVLHYSRVKGVTYWVIDQRETAKLRPQFADLLQGHATPDISPIYEDTFTAEKMIVYRLAPAQSSP